jgi:hypothetical protein
VFEILIHLLEPMLLLKYNVLIVGNNAHVGYRVSCIEETICFDKLKVNSTGITCIEHDISVILSSVIIFIWFLLKEMLNLQLPILSGHRWLSMGKSFRSIKQAALKNKGCFNHAILSL